MADVDEFGTIDVAIGSAFLRRRFRRQAGRSKIRDDEVPAVAAAYGRLSMIS
jgi:hypothetical protein